MIGKNYRYLGIVLISLTFIIIASTLLSQIFSTGALTRGYGSFDYVYDFFLKGVWPSLIVLILGFFPGLFYHRFSDEKDQSNKLVKLAAILKTISLIIMLFAVVTFFFSCITGCDGIGEGIFALMVGIPAVIIYSIGVLLIVIYKFKTKEFKLKMTEKIVITIIIILGILVWVVYKIAPLISN